MKPIIPRAKGSSAGLAIGAGVLLVGLAMAEPTTPVPALKALVALNASKEIEPVAAAGPGSLPKVIRIEPVAPIQAKEPAREVTWLGVSTEEASEALASQLGLKANQGLVVIYVASDSPADKAGLQKFDVLVEMGDQLLVDPAQLRKLIQMRNEGDSISLTLHREGKKLTVPVKLGKRTEASIMWREGQAMAGSQSPVAFAFSTGPADELASAEATKALHESLARASLDKHRVNVEIQRSMEEVRKAIEESMRHSAHALGPGAKEMEELARAKVGVEDGATVTVTKDGASVKSIVKSDDSGVIVIVASPKKHLTAHDKDGKLLFDGPVETPEDQEKVPAELWEKVKPLLQQIKPADDAGPKPRAQSEDEPKAETKSHASELCCVNRRNHGR